MITRQRDDVSTLSSTEFDFICKFVYDATGIVLNDKKREMVYRRLTRIIRERKLPSFSSYCDLLKSNPESEKVYLVNAITTNLTSFFREQHHFDYIAQYELPRLLKTNALNKRIRIWSSASSSGEEPYSIAITLSEFMKEDIAHWNVKILATDIDSEVLLKGKNGIYSESSIEDMAINIQKRYFRKGCGKHLNAAKAAAELSRLITFKQLNLLDKWPMKGPFDIIFCRNVIIYFDKATQVGLFERYYHLLAPGGLLILGHSESLGTYQQYFESVGRTIFRKPI